MNMTYLKILAAAAATAIALASPIAAIAAGDSSATEEPAAMPTKTDEALYQEGKTLAEAGEYDKALAVLAKITKQDDAKVLNYIGYSHRKAGRVEIAIETYKKAIALDPNFVQARAYLGEGYISAGQIELAKAELAEIKTRCGETCKEYTELSTSLATAVSQ
jgi:Flp pilus assembly protein TadD